MKHYRKIYEDVFATDKEENKAHRLRLEKISVDNMRLEEYTSLFHTFLNGFYKQLFDGCVRVSWLRRKFKFHGKPPILPMNKNSIPLCLAFSKFLKRNVGNDIQVLTRGKFFSKVESYFEDFFPGFMDGDPFENPRYYAFPYKNISIEYLVSVHQLEDRLGLLKEADEKNMTYAVFMDYVINHILSANDELGRNRFEVRHDKERNFPIYIKDTEKDIKRVKTKRK
jgi:hypothetical protein